MALGLAKSRLSSARWRCFATTTAKRVRFGDTSISATTNNAQNTSIYASTDSTTPGRMVLVALNKNSSAITANIALNNTSQHYTSFAVYQLTSASALNSAGTVANPAYVNTYPIADLGSFSMLGYSVNTIVPLVAAPAGTISDWNTTAASKTDWTAGANWTPNGSPGFGIADVARFGNATTIAAGATVNLNSNEIISQLVNRNANSWTLASGVPAGNRLTLNEITQSASATLMISAPICADGSNQLTFDGAGTGQVTTSGAVSGNGGQGSLLKLVKSSADTLEVEGGLSLGTGSSLTINGGRLRLNINSGSASVGSGVTANISGSSVLELAGSVSALGTTAPANRVTITNSSNAAAGLLISAGNQQVGGISGTGNTQVNAGVRLTTDHIIQSAAHHRWGRGQPSPRDDRRKRCLGQSARPVQRTHAGRLFAIDDALCHRRDRFFQLGFPERRRLQRRSDSCRSICRRRWLRRHSLAGPRTHDAAAGPARPGLARMPGSGPIAEPSVLESTGGFHTHGRTQCLTAFFFANKCKVFALTRF